MAVSCPKRKRIWQSTYRNRRHIMSDIQPYVCTIRSCPMATRTWVSASDHLNHEVMIHDGRMGDEPFFDLLKRVKHEDFLCPFCGFTCKGAKGPNSRTRHVGRHMEEIAFTVVSKVYEDWDFYSESSLTNSDRTRDDQARVGISDLFPTPFTCGCCSSQPQKFKNCEELR